MHEQKAGFLARLFVVCPVVFDLQILRHDVKLFNKRYVCSSNDLDYPGSEGLHGRDMTKPKKVLVVDASKVVRASLVKHLRENFEICEEGNGESAWQSLVLDSSIVAVLSGLDMAKTEGSGLVERIRASKLQRLNSLPFFLLASPSFSEEDKASARQLGVTDFVPKASAEQAISCLFDKLANPEAVPPVMARISQMVADGEHSDIGLSDFMSRIGRLAPLSGETSAGSVEERRQPSAYVSGQFFLSSVGNESPVGIIVFGLDSYRDFLASYGQELSDKVVSKFSRLLTGKIRGEDSVLYLPDGYIAIVSPTANRDQCANFAGRVCKALAKAHISVRGQRVATTVSVGVAAIPEETGETSANDLLQLALRRLESAIALGGNQAVFGSVCQAEDISREKFLAQLQDVLAKAAPGKKMSCKSWMNLVCVACREARQSGELSPCLCDPTGGFCGQCATTFE